MKVGFNSQAGYYLEAEGDDHRAVFEQLASLQEIFAENQCAACKSDRGIKLQVRNVDDNKFYEMVCQNGDCRAKLAFGCHKKGNSLFPKRKDDDGNYKGTYGWEVWQGKAAKSAPSPKPKAGKGKAQPAEDDGTDKDIPF